MSEEKNSFLQSLAQDTKKIGRFAALIIILGVAGAISISVAFEKPDMAKDILEKWMTLAGYAVMFYFLVNKPQQDKP